MNLRNNKGLMGAQIAFLSMALCMSVASYQLRHSHRERKAISFCEQTTMTTDQCEAAVETWSKAQVLSFIQDNDAGEQSRADFGVPVPQILEKNFTHR